MSNRISIKEVEQAIAGSRCIAVRTDQVIWLYANTNKGWVRVRTELSSPEAAERRLVVCADEGDLALDTKASGDATALLEWFDEVLHARVSDLKMGFIFCGDGNKQEPAIAVCAHVLRGAQPSVKKMPVPFAGEYGRAYCADCAAKAGVGHLRIICYPCYLHTRTGGLVKGKREEFAKLRTLCSRKPLPHSGEKRNQRI